MKLKNAIIYIPKTIRIRIFVGCQTVFDNRIMEIPKSEFNLMMRPYMDCEVIRTLVNNGKFIMEIK